jgi:putative alpha-1,2-mannosidase
MKQARFFVTGYSTTGMGTAGKNIRLAMKRGLLLVLLLCSLSCLSQTINSARWVNPFIGTGSSDVYTRWGSEGGCYPGAVAPWGAVQLTPETHAGTGGYRYADSSILFFSCAQHNSGFPNGSAGRIKIMPFDTRSGYKATAGLCFDHRDESASPGYYRVQFRNGLLAEATATPRCGLFRFRFPAGMAPAVFIGDMGAIRFVSPRVIEGTGFHTVITSSHNVQERQAINDGYTLLFGPAADTAVTITLTISHSSADAAGARQNIQAETGTASFEQIHARTAAHWNLLLAAVTLPGSSDSAATVFYTALYHALLLPYILSDADGRYRGADGKIHRTAGKAEYTGFSPWDTYRTLHPLLSLLYPAVQEDMVRSLLDYYRQTGRLPTESMTGNHAVAIIADACSKGIAVNPRLAYAAMRANLLDTPFVQQDMQVYRQQGYIPAGYPESVTRTVEYAYDDWVLWRFSQQVLHRNDTLLQKQGYSYRNLFSPEAMFLVPRTGDHFVVNPSTAGYKEGDKWVYTYAVPHHTKDLINLLGGDSLFAARLDSALRTNTLVFDNETVFQVPYLFNEAGYPALTQQWVQYIMLHRFANTPGGLPGNDDLGAVSAWYVFSALGIYPFCPGAPFYTTGVPLFPLAVVHLPNGRTLRIEKKAAAPAGVYTRVQLNGQPLTGRLQHQQLMKGGQLVFDGGTTPKQPVDTTAYPVFRLRDVHVSNNSVQPGEPFRVYYTLENKGATATKQLVVWAGNRVCAVKNCLVPRDGITEDSITCRLYPSGSVTLRLENAPPIAMTVTAGDTSRMLYLHSIRLRPVLQAGQPQQWTYTAQNTGGYARRFVIPAGIDGRRLRYDTLLLQPGEEKKVQGQYTTGTTAGMHRLSIGQDTVVFKTYTTATGSSLLDLRFRGHIPTDHSGFSNQVKAMGEAAGSTTDTLTGWPFGNSSYLEMQPAPVLDRLDTTLTMMAWVYPVADSPEPLVDLLSKGDNHVLQVSGNRTLTFFAGGWGRGDCSAPLPANWLHHWHHIAGVCTGDSLVLYIDGIRQAAACVGKAVPLTVPNLWQAGRNEEFPGTRIFRGYMKRIALFYAALSEAEIKEQLSIQ